jgi:hypothetical protein
MIEEKIKWRYNKDKNAFIAFTGNSPYFNTVIGYVSRFDTGDSEVSNGWMFEVKDGWFGKPKLIKTGFYHKFSNIKKMVEALLHTV